MKPLYLEEESGCSREAELTAQSTQPIRLSSIIIAEDIGEKWLTYFKTKTPVCQTNVLKIIIMTNKRPGGTNGSLGTRLIRVSLGLSSIHTQYVGSYINRPFYQVAILEQGEEHN